MRRLALSSLALVALAACDQNPTQSLQPSRPANSISASSSAAGITVASVPGHIWGLNNAGQAVGDLPSRTAFLWSDGVVTDLGDVPGESGTIAWTINDAGQVVGTTDAGAAFLWESGTGFTVLGSGSAESISNAEAPLIVGASDLGPTVWEFDGTSWVPTALPSTPAPWAGSAFDVNDHGDVTGVEVVDGHLLATNWTRGPSGWVKQSLGTLPGKALSIANGINNAGQVSGWSSNPGSIAFFWEDGAMHALPALPGGTTSFAYMINEYGDVAGGSNSSDSPREAVLWRNGIPIALPRPEGATVCHAVRVNEAGQVGGNCTIDGVEYPVIWEVDQAVATSTADRLEAAIANGEITNKGVAASLQSKLAAAQDALERGNVTAAVNGFHAFAEEVEAQSGKQITEAAAAVLAAGARVAADYLARG